MQWIPLGCAAERLLVEAEAMYWRAMRLEIATIIHSLHKILLQEPPLEELFESNPSYLDLKQRLSIRIVPYVKAWWPFTDSFETSDGIEVEVAKKALLGDNGDGGAKGLQDRPVEYRLARMLLAGAGFLDIDKLVEYRQPQFPSQCGEPQLGIFEHRVEHLDKGAMDVQFVYLTCNDCGKVFRAPYYECAEGCRHKDYGETGETFAVCAACYLSTRHDAQHLRKRLVHYAFTEEVAKELCQCPGVENPLRVIIDFEDPERWEELFDERRRTKRTLEGHVKGCQYLKMEAKRKLVVKTVNEREDKDYQERLREQDEDYTPPLGEQALKMFPKILRDRYFPMGNVHVGIMFGPLVIENGVKHTKRGAVISCRGPPNLGTVYQAIKGLNQRDVEKELAQVLVVSGDKSRQLFSTNLPTLKQRRLNASVKQIIGGLFSGHEPSWAKGEELIICKILESAKSYKPGLTMQYNQEQASELLKSAEAIVETFKEAVGDTVHGYLHLLLGRFSDRRFQLTWNQTSNNCQAFCDRMILAPELATVFPAHHSLSGTRLSSPNYLLSFAARFPALSTEDTLITSKLDSYFHNFHQDLDIIDSYEAETESESPSVQDKHGEFELIRCNRLLLWDCMGQPCSLPDHIWRHVSDSASILQFHLLRHYEAYSNDHWSTGPTPSDRRTPRLTIRQWLRQRVQVLLGIDVLISLAAGIVTVFREMERKSIHQERQVKLGSIVKTKSSTTPLWGQWKPGSSDRVGRHGPELMADTEEGEKLVLELLGR